MQAYADTVRTTGGKILVHGAEKHIETRVLAVCAAILIGPAREKSLSNILARITEVQGQLAKTRERPLGLPAWHLKALFELAVEQGHHQDHESLSQITSNFECANTPQDVLESFAWRRGSKCESQEGVGGEDVDDYPCVYGSTRNSVWYGGHRMVVETVCGDPRVAFVHNLVTGEEAQELISAAQNVGLKQSLVGNMKERYQHAVPPTPEEIREEAAREGRTSTSCRVERSLPVSAAVVLRVSHIVGMSPYCSEAVQVVHYEEGQEYQVHNDWFQPDDPFYHDRVRIRGQRLVSVFCYLCDVPEGGGGGTFFPELALRFLPRTGCAALWYNRTHDTKEMDERVAHCGEKPSKGHEKWGLNVWMRERASMPGGQAVYRRDRMGRIVTEDGLIRFTPYKSAPA